MLPDVRYRAMPDTVSDVCSARTGIGQLPAKTPEQVRRAQVVVASSAMHHNGEVDLPPEREAALREVLTALGIYNREARIETRPERRDPRVAGDVAYPTAGPRERNGRLSRRKKRE